VSLEGWPGIEWPRRARSVQDWPGDDGKAVGLDTLKIRDAQDVEQVVRAALASEQPLEIVGHGSKRQIGQPMATNALLDMSALNAVRAYEPNELIITVQAGAPLSDVQ
jgi:glycolate oxidase FAD binding subunit